MTPEMDEVLQYAQSSDDKRCQLAALFEVRWPNSNRIRRLCMDHAAAVICDERLVNGIDLHVIAVHPDGTQCDGETFHGKHRTATAKTKAP